MDSIKFNGSLPSSAYNVTSWMTSAVPHNLTSQMTSALKNYDITTSAMKQITSTIHKSNSTDGLNTNGLPEDLTTYSMIITTQCGECVSQADYYNNMMWWFTITGALGLLTLFVGIIYFILWFFFMYEHAMWACDCIHKKLGLTCPGEEGGRPSSSGPHGERTWSLLESTDKPDRKFQSTKIGRKQFSFS